MLLSVQHMDMLDLYMHWKGTWAQTVILILTNNSFTHLFLYRTWPIHVGLRCD